MGWTTKYIQLYMVFLDVLLTCLIARAKSPCRYPDIWGSITIFLAKVATITWRYPLVIKHGNGQLLICDCPLKPSFICKGCSWILQFIDELSNIVHYNLHLAQGFSIAACHNLGVHTMFRHSHFHCYIPPVSSVELHSQAVLRHQQGPPEGRCHVHRSQLEHNHLITQLFMEYCISFVSYERLMERGMHVT